MSKRRHKITLDDVYGFIESHGLDSDVDLCEITFIVRYSRHSEYCLYDSLDVVEWHEDIKVFIIGFVDGGGWALKKGKWTKFNNLRTLGKLNIINGDSRGMINQDVYHNNNNHHNYKNHSKRQIIVYNNDQHYNYRVVKTNIKFIGDFFADTKLITSNLWLDRQKESCKLLGHVPIMDGTGDNLLIDVIQPILSEWLLSIYELYYDGKDDSINPLTYIFCMDITIFVNHIRKHEKNIQAFIIDKEHLPFTMSEVKFCKIMLNNDDMLFYDGNNGWNGLKREVHYTYSEQHGWI